MQGFAAGSFVSTECSHVLLDTIKMSEDRKAVVVRLYEYKNEKDSDVCLIFGRTVKRVTETDLCEEQETEIELSDNKMHFGIGCYEIKTFKIYV